MSVWVKKKNEIANNEAIKTSSRLTLYNQIIYTRAYAINIVKLNNLQRMIIITTIKNIALRSLFGL